MFSNKMDFSSCVIWIDFYKCGHILVCTDKSEHTSEMPGLKSERGTY